MNTPHAGPEVLRCFRPSTALRAVTLLLLAGCQTWQRSHETALAQYAAGELPAARESLRQAFESRRAEKRVLQLDDCMLQLASGEVSGSETGFRHLREELAYLAQKDLREQTAAVLSDSRSISWSGREFERQMVLNFALLTSLLGDRQDAFAWSMQVAEASTQRFDSLQKAAQDLQPGPRLAEVSHPDDIPAVPSEPDDVAIQPASASTLSGSSPRTTRELLASREDQPLALGAYLATLVQSEIPTRTRETDELLSSIRLWNPAFSAELRDGAGFGLRSQPGHGAVHVIALVGRAPQWVSESVEPTSAALLIADRLISITGRHTLPPTISAVKIARPEPCPLAPAANNLTCQLSATPASHADARPAAVPLRLATAVDLNAVALASYEATRDEQIAQAIARRVVKKGVVYAIKETQKISRNTLVDFGINAAGVAWEALEQPDTRCWRSLPARVDIGRVELPAGNYMFRLSTSAARFANAPVNVEVPVADGRNTCVVVIIPDDRPAGHVLIGGPESRQVAIASAASIASTASPAPR